MEGQLGEAQQNLTQCVTFQRGVHGTVADAMLSNGAANNGGGPILRVGGNDESLLRFDISSIPASAVVNSATLQLYVNGSAGDTAVNIHRVTAPWSEGTVTFASFQQSFSPAISGAVLPGSKNALKSADITGLVASWVSGAQPNNGMLLETSDSKKSIFVSSDANGNAPHPALTVCYTTPDDHCASNPCVNGTCQNGATSHTCSCDPGWAGASCDVNMNECADQPCQNGGTCTDLPNAYSCACAAGYTGTNCETLIDNCASGPCQNGGVCTNGVNTYTCTCAAGYTGASCETLIDNCASQPCVNGACTNGVNSFSCACATGWTGMLCDVNIDDCAGNSCQNGATCVDGLNSYTCACLPGFGGTSCETNLDDCASNPCLNGGTCTDGVDSYSCTCAAGYEGTSCEVDINDCASNPCQNGGVCVDGVNSYTCTCPSGYSGTNCENQSLPPRIYIDFCAPGDDACLYFGACGNEYEPVCGPDGVTTYRNPCIASGWLGAVNDVTWNVCPNLPATFPNHTICSTFFWTPYCTTYQGMPACCDSDPPDPELSQCYTFPALGDNRGCVNTDTIPEYIYP